MCGGLGGLCSLRLRIEPNESVLSSATLVSCDDEAPTDTSAVEPTRSGMKAYSAFMTAGASK